MATKEEVSNAQMVERFIASVLGSHDVAMTATDVAESVVDSEQDSREQYGPAARMKWYAERRHQKRSQTLSIGIEIVMTATMDRRWQIAGYREGKRSEPCFVAEPSDEDSFQVFEYICFIIETAAKLTNSAELMSLRRWQGKYISLRQAEDVAMSLRDVLRGPFLTVTAVG